MGWLEDEWLFGRVGKLPFSFEFEQKAPQQEAHGIVCISGKLKSFPTKNAATAALCLHGYDVKSSVTKDVTILVNGLAENREDLALAFEEYYPSLRESAELYRLQCVHCHGPSGGGDGPTAPFLDPRPRDYRRGIFKFTALADKSRPRREDLYRTLTDGVYTTAMPSFRRFGDADLEGLVDYVRLLSIRGETELLLALEYEYDAGLPMEVVQETYLDVWEKWEGAYEKVIAFDGEVPDASPERIAHGRELYMDAKGANCVSCHGMAGRGDGASAFEVVVDEAGNEQTVNVSDDWGEKINVRDLTRGIYRFGGRPIDLYRRIHAGINGTPMPSHAALKKPDGSRLLSDDDLWDIVYYARSLGTRPLHVHVAETADSDEHGESH